MKKTLICAAALLAMQAATAADLAWIDVESQLTPVGAGESASGALAAFDSWGRKDIAAVGACGTAVAPFVSRFVDSWASGAMSVDLHSPGFLLFFR